MAEGLETDGPGRVLVAEDDPSVRMTIQFLLSEEGFDVLLARDGAEALDMAREVLPDVILLDQMMPKMSGQEVLTALRADATTHSIPVVVLSGMAKGAPSDWPGAHFVGKPFTPEDLVSTIQGLIPSP